MRYKKNQRPGGGGKKRKSMSRNKMLLATNSVNGEKLTPKEVAFIDAYIKTKKWYISCKTSRIC